jgi:hypothetical protein
VAGVDGVDDVDGVADVRSITVVYSVAFLGRAAKLVEGAVRAPGFGDESVLAGKRQDIPVRAVLTLFRRGAPAARAELL